MSLRKKLKDIINGFRNNKKKKLFEKDVEKMVYDWILCRENGRYHPENALNLNYPSKIFKIIKKEDVIEIRMSKILKGILELSENLEDIVDFEKLYNVFLEATKGLYYDHNNLMFLHYLEHNPFNLGKREGFGWFWLILAKTFEEIYKKWPIKDEFMLEDLFNDIYSYGSIPILGRLKYGFAYLLALYRLYHLEMKRNVKILKDVENYPIPWKHGNKNLLNFGKRNYLMSPIIDLGV